MKLIRCTRAIKHTLILALLFSSRSIATDYGVGPLNETDTIYFKSTAKLEFIEGQTHYVNGYFSFEPGNPNSAISAKLRVDLRTLKTGIDKRDEHMRENHLHTDKYPYAFFEIDSIAPIPTLTTFDSVYTTKAAGRFYIHGHYRRLNSDLQILRKKLSHGSETIKVRAKFSIDLDKYKIPRPKALFLKLAETIEIEAVFTGSTEITRLPIELPEWRELE